MNLSKLLNWNYLFQTYTTDRLSTWTLLILCAICVVLLAMAIFSQIKVAKNPGIKKVLLKKMIAGGWSFSLIGLFLIFFRETRAMYLGSRFWLLLWLLALIVWVVYVVIYILRTIPRLQKQHEENKEFSKWLPKAKK